MIFDVKRDAATSIVIPTSMGVRITPKNRQPVHTAREFVMQVTSAESNVGSIASFLGEPVKILTALVKGSPIARMIADDLGRRHMDLEAKEVDPGGPWGHRHQFNVADAGFGARGPRVYNDRSGEVGRALAPGDFDLARIFEQEGARIVHTSGLFAALSSSAGELCVEIARAAKAAGTLVSFDLNHRASFWEGREEQLRATFCEIASLADIVVGNEEDFQLALGLQGPEAGGTELAGKTEGFKGMIEEAGTAFPGVRLFATTLREVVSANEHLWGAILRAGGIDAGGSGAAAPAWHIVEPRPIPVHDRIGGGDGFVGGLLHAILQGWDAERALHFGWAAGALAVTMETDHAQPADEAQIWTIWEGDARVQR
jgi:2-dehydro-3-deoxygluconokinase